MQKCFRVLIRLGLRNKILKSKAFLPPKTVNYKFTETGEVELIGIEKVECPSTIKVSGIHENKDSPALMYFQNEKNTKRKLIIYFHQTQGCLGLSYNKLVEISKFADVDILAVEYAGYGLNKKLDMGDIPLIKHAIYGYKYATTTLKFKPKDIILYGFSIGTGPSTFLSSHPDYPTSGLILQGPYVSGIRQLNTEYTTLDSKDFFPNGYYMAFVDVPTLIIHAEDDESCKFSEGEHLFNVSLQNYPPAYFKKGGHFEVFNINKQEFLVKMKKFIDHNYETMKDLSETEYSDKYRGSLQDADDHMYNQEFKPVKTRKIDYCPKDLAFIRKKVQTEEITEN